MAAPLGAGGASDYYKRLLAASPIDAVARDLLGSRVTLDNGTRMACDCPHHPSQSKTSLNVDKHAGLWYEFGCGVGGDVIQLVEFVQSGKVTKKGEGGRMSDTHRAARDWLAQRAGMEPLSKIGSKESEAVEARRIADDEVFLALTDLADINCERLLKDEKALAWCKEKWGLTEDAIARLKIGISSDSADYDALIARGHDPRVALSTGAFSGPDRHGNILPFFKRRITLPYRSHGRVVYMIGRKTPWTPDLDWEKGKYKKLPIYDETTNNHVSRSIRNDHLWGEDILATKPAVVAILEGVTDAIAAQEAGFPAISPVTVRLSAVDTKRIVRKLRDAGVDRVVLIEDNEVSGIGLDASLDTASTLEREGIRCGVAILPLGDPQRRARAELAEMIGAELWAKLENTKPAQRGAIIRDALKDRPGDASKAEALIERGKIDVAEWFRAGGTPDGFREIVAGAVSVVDYAVSRAPKIADNPVEQVRAIEGLLAALSRLGKATQDAALKALKDRVGLPVSTLRDEMRRAARVEKESGKRAERTPGAAAAEGTAEPSRIPRSDPETCRGVIDVEVATYREAKLPVDWVRVANVAHTWLEQRGTIFMRRRNGEPMMFHENVLYEMSSMDAGAKARFTGVMMELTGMVPTTAPGRTLYTALAAIAASRGQVRDTLGWIATDHEKHVVHVTPGHGRTDVIRIAPDGVTVAPNGTNDENVILSTESSIEPIEFDPNVDHTKLEDELHEVVGSKLACSPGDRFVIMSWFCVHPLIENTGTRPIMRCQGMEDSGKTWASKMITTILFGREAQKRATLAANWADSSRNPMIALDNVEMKNFDDDTLDFYLMVSTGVTRQKRARGSDHATVEERPCCLLMSSGIEPLGAGLGELHGRTFIAKFDRSIQSAALIESDTLAEIRKRRHTIMSMIWKRASVTLGMIAEGAHRTAMLALRQAMGPDNIQRRCDEYVALMYLNWIAKFPPEKRAQMLVNIDPFFVESMRSIGMATVEESQEGNSLGPILATLFSAARGGDQEWLARSGLLWSMDRSRIVEATSTDIFNAANLMRRDRGSPQPFKNPVQLAKRMQSGAKAMAALGYSIKTTRSTKGHTLYTISIDDPRNASEDAFAQPGSPFAPAPTTSVPVYDGVAAASGERQSAAPEPPTPTKPTSVQQQKPPREKPVTEDDLRNFKL